MQTLIHVLKFCNTAGFKTRQCIKNANRMNVLPALLFIWRGEADPTIDSTNTVYFY